LQLVSLWIALLLLEIRCFFLFVPKDSSLTTIMVLLVSNVWLLSFDALETEVASAGVGEEHDDIFVEDALKEERTTAA